MLSKKTKRIIASLLVGITVFVGACISCFNLGRQQTPHSVPQQIEQKVDYSESVVEQLEAVNRLEVYEVYLKNDVTIKQGYDNSFFRNNKELKIPAIGTYKIDLDDLQNNVFINDNHVTILASLEQSVSVFEDRIQFINEQGYCVFYSVKLEPEEMANIIHETKCQMLSKMKEEEYTSKAKDRAEQVIRDTIRLKYPKMEVTVIWK